MPPDLPSRSGNPQDQVDRRQRALDGADETVDGKIDGRATEQLGAVEKQKLTQTYIGKVNDLQGSIGAVRRTVEVRRDSKAADWEELDAKCSAVERELVERLEKIDPATMKEGVDAFDSALAALEQKLGTPTEGKDAGKEAPKKASPAVMRLLKSLNLDAKVIQECAEDPAKLRAVQEEAKDKGGRTGDRIAAMREEESGLLKQLADETGKSTYDFVDTFTDKTIKENESVKATIARIKKVRATMQPLVQQKLGLDKVVSTLDIALRVMEADDAAANNDTDGANRRLTKLLELNGSDLADTDPEIAKRAQTAAETLRSEGKLSSTEEAILFSDPSSPEALSRAIQAKADSSPTADIIDQLGAKETFKVGPFKTVKERFAINSPNVSVMYNKRNVLGALSNTEITTLTYPDKTVEVAATPQAKAALQKIPEGFQPIILKPVQSMGIKLETSSRGGFVYSVRGAPSSFIIQDYDVGYVDKSGKVFRTDGKTEVDVAKSPNKDAIESQLSVQRGFTVTKYKPKYELRDMKGGAYGGLRNITTQSGVSVEGVRIDEDVEALIQQTPPKGKTLVLKRIPTGVQLREMESTGRNGTNFQRVLSVDRITKEDLTYASIDGESLSTVGLDGKNAKTESAKDATKEQGEESSDIERVLDRNPSVHYVKRTASTIQQTFGHLQSFLEAGQKGSAREAFVSFAREEAKPTLDLLKNPETRKNVDEARRVLQALKGSNGVALGGAEKAIDAQLKALDQFTALLTNPAVLNTLETLMDASKFDEDSWANFAANELPVIAASVAAAVAAAAIIVATMGSAAPFIAIAAATAAGGIVGAELGKEALYQFRQNVDADVISGKKTFTARSRVGKYAEGTAQFNAETGQYEGPDFLRDVTNPLAIEFATSFAVTLGTMGLGSLAGSGLSKILQNSKVVERLAARSDIMKIVARKLTAANANKEALIKATNLKDALGRAIKEFPKEVLEEGGEELQESILENICNQIDVALSATDGQNGQLGLGAAAGLLLAIGKNTKIGKKTLTYTVGANIDPEVVEARKAELTAQLEAEGAEVTDLGKGYLSVRYAVQAEDGSTQYETVQLMPVKRDAPTEANNALLAEDIPDDAADVSVDASAAEDTSVDLDASVSLPNESQGDTPAQPSTSTEGSYSDFDLNGSQSQAPAQPSGTEEVAPQGAPQVILAPPTGADSAAMEASSNDRGSDSTVSLPTPNANDLNGIGVVTRARVGARPTDEVRASPLGSGGQGVVAGVDVIGDETSPEGSSLPILEKDSYATKVSTRDKEGALKGEKEAADAILAKSRENVRKAVDEVVANLPADMPDADAAKLIAERVGQVMPVDTPALTAFLLIQRRDNPGISWENAMGRALDVFRGPVPRAYESRDGNVAVADRVIGKNGQSILTDLQSLPPETLESLGYGYVLALRSATDAGLVYRDFKSENTIIDPNGVVRLIDLGLAKKEGTSDGAGTPATSAPEQFTKTSPVTEKSDVFAAGAVLYQLFSKNGTYPIPDIVSGQGKSPQNIFMLLKVMSTLTPEQIEGVVEQNVDADPEVKTLIVRMLSPDPAQRPTLQEVQDALYERVGGRLDSDRQVIGNVVRQAQATDRTAPAGADPNIPEGIISKPAGRQEDTNTAVGETTEMRELSELEFAAQSNDTRSLREHFKATDAPIEERVILASFLLAISINPKQEAAIREAYDLPGEAGNLTPEQRRAKILALTKDDAFDRLQVDSLLLAGIFEKPTATDLKVDDQGGSDPKTTPDQVRDSTPSTPQSADPDTPEPPPMPQDAGEETVVGPMPLTPEDIALQKIGDSTRGRVGAPQNAEVQTFELGEGGMGSVARVDIVGDTTSKPGDLPILDSASYATKTDKEGRDLTTEKEVADIILSTNKENVRKAVDKAVAELPPGFPDEIHAEMIATRVGRVMPVSTPALTGFLLIQRRDNPGISWQDAMDRALEVFRGPVPRTYDSESPDVLTADRIIGKDGGAVEADIQKLPQSVRETQAYGYVLAARSAADAKVIYRDFKPENTVIDANGVTRLIDLGLATKEGEYGSGGTPLTASPEQVVGEGMTPKSDVFNAGAVLYSLFSKNGNYPITDVLAKADWELTSESAVAMLPMLEQSDIDAAIQENITASPKVKELIGRMLSVDPAQRPTMEEVEDALYKRVATRLDSDRRIIGNVVRERMGLPPATDPEEADGSET